MVDDIETQNYEDLLKELASLRKKLDVYENTKILVGKEKLTIIEANKRFNNKIMKFLDKHDELEKEVKDLRKRLQKIEGERDDAFANLNVQLKRVQELETVNEELMGARIAKTKECSKLRAQLQAKENEKER